VRLDLVALLLDVLKVARRVLLDSSHACDSLVENGFFLLDFLESLGDFIGDFLKLDLYVREVAFDCKSELLGLIQVRSPLLHIEVLADLEFVSDSLAFSQPLVGVNSCLYHFSVLFLSI
jgi:hypothetical protein